MSESSKHRDLLENAGNLALRLYADESILEGKSMTAQDEQHVGDVITNMTRVEAELKKPAAKAAICAALISGSDDLKEITKVAGAALIPLMLTGVISLPLTPFALAVAGLFIFRLGVSSYCQIAK